ncbi:unnamed protein product (macronuclear) [Paramecium tetraurelia]|uniref:E2F/DP family winged-helix DNA-binding domain-containing protein n=1 Tax=Paramecium tetraurelia TaxID=5888 RepID=A0CYJ2_PARTE|nr:uncharacterized protein GSPATT00011459001 [Paramecium tetraurelia]CAK75859.1 unnamed protein product [Paramecium tetraurelia]|eukprot:XP_001443256.1 hypothetical protein (macronuclear) [Paramecium tetraurelia strain d4-2]
MDFTGQFRLDEDSLNFNVFQTPVKGTIKGIKSQHLSHELNQLIHIQTRTIFGAYTIIWWQIYIFQILKTPAILKLILIRNCFKCQFNSPKSLKKWSLKYISKRVEKELQNHTVGYSEICQKLTDEMTKEMEGHQDYGLKDVKNLRRRVYDALNVMISVGIVVKEKKLMRKNTKNQVNITKQNLIIRKQKLKELLLQKKEQLTNSIKKQEALQNLIRFNKERQINEQEKIKFPFLLVKTQLTNSEEEELILESHKSMDYLKVLSKNKLQIFGILGIAQQLFQNQQTKN